MTKNECNTLFVLLSLHFNGYFSRWIWVSWYQNVSILDFIGALGECNTAQYKCTKTAKLMIHKYNWILYIFNLHCWVCSIKVKVDLG